MADTEDILMQNEGLELVPEPDSQEWKNWQLIALFKEYGPIMFSWKKPRKNNPDNTHGHYCVLVGINTEDDMVVYHDPENGRDQDMGMFMFNERLYWKMNSMLRRKAQKHAPRVRLTVR